MQDNPNLSKKMPESIKIGKVNWTIKWEKPPQGKSKKRTYGLCNFQKHEITIDPDVDDLELCDSYIHEVLHALFPNASEGKVLRATDVILKIITDDLINILDRKRSNAS